MVAGFQAHPEPLRPPPESVRGEEPEMLRRRHQTPPRAGQACETRAEISRREHDQSAGLQPSGATPKGIERIRKMLDYIEQHEDVRRTEAIEILLAGNAGQNVQPFAAALSRRILRELDAGNVKTRLRLLQKEAIGAADLDQPSGRAIAANELDLPRELAPQYPLRPKIVGVAVRMLSGKILARVVRAWIEAGGIGSSEPAGRAAQDIAAIFDEEVLVRDGFIAGRTVQTLIEA